MTEPVPLPDRITGFRSRAINGIIDYLESLRPVDSASVVHTWMPTGVVSRAESRRGTGAGWPFGKRYAFGLNLSGAVATVYNLYYQIGNEAAVEVDSASVTVSDPSSEIRVWAQFDPIYNELTIQYGVATGPDFTDTSKRYRELYVLQSDGDSNLTYDHEVMNGWVDPARAARGTVSP